MPSGGHNKKSAEAHRREGTVRKSRGINLPPPPPANEYSAPVTLSKNLSSEWDRLVGDLRGTGKPVGSSDLDTLARAFSFLSRCEEAGKVFDKAVESRDIANIAKLAGSLNSLAGRAYNIIETVKRSVLLRDPASGEDRLSQILKKAKQ